MISPACLLNTGWSTTAVKFSVCFSICLFLCKTVGLYFFIIRLNLFAHIVSLNHVLIFIILSKIFLRTLFSNFFTFKCFFMSCSQMLVRLIRSLIFSRFYKSSFFFLRTTSHLKSITFLRRYSYSSSSVRI